MMIPCDLPVAAEASRSVREPSLPVARPLPALLPQWPFVVAETCDSPAPAFSKLNDAGVPGPDRDALDLTGGRAERPAVRVSIQTPDGKTVTAAYFTDNPDLLNQFRFIPRLASRYRSSNFPRQPRHDAGLGCAFRCRPGCQSGLLTMRANP
jgi:hypothetical protein